jgi:hypothetical protein
MNRPAQPTLSSEPAAEIVWLDLVRQQVNSLRYGIVQIVVHDGNVTQIEKTERVRLDDRTQKPAQARQPLARDTTINS